VNHSVSWSGSQVAAFGQSFTRGRPALASSAGDRRCRAPAREIAKLYGKSIRTARNWIWEARRREYLPKTTWGKIQPNAGGR
jgi:hypothetical protein